jgi:hypothetical protein
VPTRTGLLLHDVAGDGRVRPATAQLRADFDADVDRWRACAAVLGPGRHQDALRAQVTTLTGREPVALDGVFLWRDLGGS